VPADNTPPASPRPPEPPFLERKEKPGGKIYDYHCTLAHAEPGFVIVRFVVPNFVRKPATPLHTPIPIPPGTTSFGYFWHRRAFDVYRMLAPGGSLVAHRFEAISIVSLDDSSIHYRDLVLDWWAFPDGRLIEEDRDELDDLVAAGAVSSGDAERANAVARHVFGRYRHIIDEVVAIESRLGLQPSPPPEPLHRDPRR
jgi:hypothetical protein